MAAGRAPSPASPRPAAARRGSSGFLTEPGCVTAAWPREPPGVLNHARRRCWPRSGCPWVPAASSAGRRGGRAAKERAKRGRDRVCWGRARPGGPGGVPRAARGASPSAAAAGAAFGFPCRPSALLQSEPPRQGASVAGSRPPRRVAVSSSTSGAPAAVGGGASSVVFPAPVFVSLCVCPPAAIARDPQPGRPRGRVSPGRPDAARSRRPGARALFPPCVSPLPGDDGSAVPPRARQQRAA